jgi:ELWxxDGT repeat protein
MKKTIILLTILTGQLVSAQGPVIVKTVNGIIPEPYSKDQSRWFNNEWNGLFFYQGTGSPSKLCITDGTNAGTRYLADIGSGDIITTIPAQDFIYIITNRLVSFSPFTYETELWKSNGTGVGTTLVYTFQQIPSTTLGHNWTSNRRNQNFSVSGNLMYFSGYDAANGAELWVTDGTTTGTHLLKDIKRHRGQHTLGLL